MSSSQDVSLSPFFIGATASLPPQIPGEPARLCETCQKAHNAALRDDSPDWTEFRDGDIPHVKTVPRKHRLPADRWPDLPRLLDSAKAGCGFCAFLREAILSHDFKDAWQDFTEGKVTDPGWELLGLELQYGHPWVLYHQYYSGGLEYLIVSITIGNTDLKIHLCFRMGAATDCPAVAEWLQLQSPAIRNYEDDATTSFLTTELQKLHGDGQSNFLPERLIDVGASSLRLVERNNINAGSAKRPQYTALSYCWGHREHAESQSKTTTKNRNDHLERLYFDALSPVLRDAVKITRRLSIPYLWVDSLCILQDDNSDWQKQCSQMNDIYGKARVTLIAASSRTCREGFLNPTRHGLRISYQSARRPEIRGSFMIYFSHVSRKRDQHGLHFLDAKRFNQDFTFSQWARRGWTFQEKVMAGACIVFGHTGVYFGRDNTFVSKNGYPVSVEPKLVPSVQRDDELHRAWENVIIRYSRFTTSSFTDPKDLLPALSGLARLFGNMLKVDYIAGHWVDRLHHSLLWADRDDYSEHPPSLNDLTKRYGQRPYLVPTWSCVRRGVLDIEFCIPYDRCSSEVTVLGVHKQLVGKNSYGEIQDASLTLDAYVLELASLSWSESSKTLLGSAGSHAEKAWFEDDGVWFEEDAFDAGQPLHVLFFLFDRECVEIYRGYKMKLNFQVEWGDRSLLGRIRGTLDQLISRATLLLLGSEIIYSQAGDSGVCRAGYGLVLVPWEGASERSFLRVGIFQPWRDVMEDSDDLPCLKRLMKKEKIKIY